MLYFFSITARLLPLLLTILLPEMALASGVDIQSIAYGLINILNPLWIPIAIVAITIAGFNLVIAQDEGQIEKSRSQILAIITGGIILTILYFTGAGRVVRYVYNSAIDTSAILSAPALFIGPETEGIAVWIISLIAVIGVILIIIALLEAVTSLGDEGSYTKVRTAVLHVVIGLVVIVGAKIIRSTFFPSGAGGVGNPTLLMAYLLAKILIILKFILVIAVAVLIYAGFRMVASFGREEDYTNAKSLVLRVVIGILVLLVSYALVQIVINIF